MSSHWLHTDTAGACARIDMRHAPPRLHPDGPEAVPGNVWYAFLVGLGATREPREIDLCWPDVQPWNSSDYNDNASFAEVLDRTLFLDAGDGEWRRIENVTLQESGVRIVVPPGPAHRRLAVGMPVTRRDLDALLQRARQADEARVERIAAAPQGTPVHAIMIGDSARAEGTFAITAYQHFSEWAGIRMIDAIVRHLLSPPGDPLRRRFRWILYPCINADALAHGWRGDPHRTAGINLNRDWGPFEQPQTRAVRDHLLAELAGGPPLLHAADLHMGWHSRDTCGAGLTVFEDGKAPRDLIAQQAAFAHWLYAKADYTDFVWRHGDIERPNFAAWASRTFGRPAQTLEVSRHRWRMRDSGRWRPPSMELQRQLGLALARSLATFYQMDRKESP